MRKLAIAAVLVCWAGAAVPATVGEVLVEKLKQNSAALERMFDHMAGALDRCNQVEGSRQRDECFTNLSAEITPRARSAAEGARQLTRTLDEMYPYGAEGVVTPKKR